VFTKGLSQFICNTNYEDLPGEVVKAAKLAILDFIGVAMAGSKELSSRIIIDTVRQDQSLGKLLLSVANLRPVAHWLLWLMALPVMF